MQPVLVFVLLDLYGKKWSTSCVIIILLFHNNLLGLWIFVSWNKLTEIHYGDEWTLRIQYSDWVNLISWKQYKAKISYLEALKIQMFQIWMDGMNSKNTLKNQILMLLFLILYYQLLKLIHRQLFLLIWENQLAFFFFSLVPTYEGLWD